MSDDREQALAGLRVLARFCWIDRQIDEMERAELRRFAGLDLDDRALAEVLAEKVELDEAVRVVTDRGIQTQVLETARRVAHAHHSTGDEEAAIATIRDAWGFSPPAPLRHEVPASRPTDISELTRRFMHKEATVEELVRKIRQNLGED